jgi:hypothetical protein
LRAIKADELNTFLPPGDRKTDRPFAFSGELTVGKAIDARGVPRALVALILVNSEPAG